MSQTTPPNVVVLDWLSLTGSSSFRINSAGQLQFKEATQSEWNTITNVIQGRNILAISVTPQNQVQIDYEDGTTSLIVFDVNNNSITPEKTTFRKSENNKTLDKLYINWLVESSFTTGGLISSTGSLTASTSGVLRTDYLAIPVGATKIRYSYSYSTGQGLINFYNTSKTRLSTITSYAEVGLDTIFPIPENTAFVILAGRGSSHVSYSQPLKIEFLDTDNNIVAYESFVNIFDYVFDINRTLKSYASKYMGMITSTTQTPTPTDSKDYYYLVRFRGTYTNFNNLVIPNDGLFLVRYLNGVQSLTTLVNATDYLTNDTKILQAKAIKPLFDGSFRVKTLTFSESSFIHEEYIDAQGAYINSTTGTLRTDFIPVPATANTIRYNYSYSTGSTLIAFYDANRTEISRVTSYTEVGSNAIFAIPSNTAFVVFTGRGSSHASYSKALKIEFLNLTTTNVTALTEQSFTVAGYISSTGSLTASTSGVLRTDYLAIPVGATQIRYSYSYTTSQGLINFYNASKTRLSTISSYTEVGTNVIFPIPTNTAFVILAGRGSSHASYSNPLKVEFLDANNNLLSLPESTYTPVLASLNIFNIQKFLQEQAEDTEITSAVNKDWLGWAEQRFVFGMDKNSVPVPFRTKTPFIADGTIICGGDTSKMRWGYHLFEGYASDFTSRVTELINKHTEEGKPVAEKYFYLSDYTHREQAYGWYKLGSDVLQHSYLFSRDVSVSFGKHDFRNVIQIASINPATDINTTYQTQAAADAAFEPELYAAENAKCVLYLALKNARNGTMWYDNVRNQLILKKNNLWHDVNTSAVAAGTYNF